MATTAPLPSELAGAHPGHRLEECGDEALATLVAEADEAAFAVLFERHYQSLYRYCRSIVHDDPDAQDALQTAWTGALVALRQGRRDAPVRPWLYRIVHNEAISILRRRRRGPEPVEAATLRAPSAEDHAMDRERFALHITAYPQYNCGNTTGCWTAYGGTSAATPQTAALVALANAARSATGKGPIGFLDPILYGGLGASAYSDVVARHYGSAPPTFAGSDVGVSGAVTKSVGDLVDNQMWEVPIAGYPTTSGYDATTGWGTPQAPAFVAGLASMP